MHYTMKIALLFAALALVIITTIISLRVVDVSAPPVIPELPPADSTSSGSSMANPSTSSPPAHHIQTHTVTLRVQKGDSLLLIFKRAGIVIQDAMAAIESIKAAHNPSRLSIGQEIVITSSLDSDSNNGGLLHLLQLDTSTTERIVVTRLPDGSFETNRISIPLSKHLLKLDTTIDSSFYLAAEQAQLSANHIVELIGIFSYDIDFQRDIRKGDRVVVLYEVFRDETGATARDGDIIYASLVSRGTPISIYLHRNKSGEKEYYSSDGRTVKKSLLRTPINGARLSSGYGMRHHPVLGYSKMHKGVDFAAPVGTPIYAAGDGIVVERRRKGSYGNYIRIKHGNAYSTAYAHLSRFHKRVRKGTRVKQGQTIGYVGRTGRVTGAHLHYEVLRSGKHVNPAKVNMPSRLALKGVELSKFKSYVSSVNELITAMRDQNDLQVAKD